MTGIVAFYNDFETMGRVIRMKKLEFVADYVPEVAIKQLAEIELNVTLTCDEFTTFVQSYLTKSAAGQKWGNLRSGRDWGNLTESLGKMETS